MDGPHLEASLSQGAGLIEDQRIHPGQLFHVIGALHQNALFGRAAQTAEKGQGNRNHQRAGAGDHQKVQGPGRPFAPLAAEKHRRNQEQQQGADDHAGGVDPGKAGDEALHLRLFGGRFLHQAQDAGHGAFRIGALHLDGDHAAQVDAAADHVFACHLVHRQAFPRQGGGVDRGGAFQNFAVQRDLFAGLHQNDLAGLNVLRRNLQLMTVPEDGGGIGTNLHQRGDGTAALAHGHALEPLAHLIEQHNGHALFVIPQRKRAQRSQRHQKLFVEDLPVQNVPPGGKQHVIARSQIGRREDQQLPQPRVGQQRFRYQPRDGQQRQRCNDPNQVLFLFPAHGNILPARHAGFALWNGLLHQNAAVRLDLFAGLDGLLQHPVEVPVLRLQRDSLQHEGNVHAFHALDFSNGVLHLQPAIGAIQFIQRIGLFHLAAFLSSVRCSKPCPIMLRTWSSAR